MNRCLRSSCAQCALGVALLLLGACSLLNPPRQAPSTAKPAPVIVAEPPHSTPPPVATPQPPPPRTAPIAPPAPPAATRQYHLGAASQSLVNQAHVQMSRGDLTAATTTLDRALHIEPQNPLLWIELARLRLAEKDGRQAESCARKALSLGSSDPITRLAAGHALVDALRAEHKEAEALNVEALPWMN
jgi:tetratricopeptide (TPR) repeat protein